MFFILYYITILIPPIIQLAIKQLFFISYIKPIYPNLIMMTKILSYILICFSLVSYAQELKNITSLNSSLEESSGLIYIGSKLITHNDSDAKAELYEIDPLTGNTNRTVSIVNATNVDWEDITFDDTYIYIGDIGNNNGTRTDLKIYRILRSDFESKNAITAETINYRYGDQTNFNNAPNANNYDSEALVAYNNKLYIFTKNWIDQKTNIYELSKTPGTNINVLEIKDTIDDISGLVTGATVNNNTLLLSGYDTTGNAFIYESRNFSSAIFSKGITSKTVLSLPNTNSPQIEGITFIDIQNIYISSEKDPLGRPASLYHFRVDNTELSNPLLDEVQLSKQKIQKVDKNHIYIISKRTKTVKIYAITGKLLTSNVTNKQIDISRFKNQIVILSIGSDRFKYIF